MHVGRCEQWQELAVGFLAVLAQADSVLVITDIQRSSVHVRCYGRWQWQGFRCLAVFIDFLTLMLRLRCNLELA